VFRRNFVRNFGIKICPKEFSAEPEIHKKTPGGSRTAETRTAPRRPPTCRTLFYICDAHINERGPML
jgi:hypothetical protein